LISQTRIDGKTGLLNAVTWQREAAVQYTRAIRCRPPADLAVLVADIDRFKQLNDTFGHQAGDVVLAACASTINGLLRPYDLCCRWGGEEFAILLPDTSEDEAESIASRLCRAVEELAVADLDTGLADQPRVTISIGVASLRPAYADFDDLVRAADHAMYQAKSAGRNRVEKVRISE
jgi:diguanylate cyclase (GGDEF)-like protein